MSWPADDVVKNIRYFLGIVKRATGNEKSVLGSKDATSSNKPREFGFLKFMARRKLSSIVEYPIVRVLLSSRQGPSIRIADY
jgi:large subunit ribosomal protein L1